MRLLKGIVLSLVVSIICWTIISWPLPCYMDSGIPSSCHNIEKYPARKMIQGDHLQLLYHFWLASDMIKGETPLFYNQYEFNTGNNEERRMPGSYFAPFSIVFAFFSFFGGQAFAWNITGLLSIWLTLVAAFLLLRRYVNDPYISACCALIAILLPYRWISLLGGSPAGFAMMWIPFIYLGIDKALRDQSITGGFLAGISYLFLSWTDSQIFFLTTLSIPFCVIAVLLMDSTFKWIDIESYLKRIKPSAIIIAFALLAFLYAAVRHHVAVQGRIGARSISEVLIFSPEWKGVFCYEQKGMNGHIYIGVPLLLILAFTSPIAITGAIKKKNTQKTIFYCIIYLSLIVIILLALGARGPRNGTALKLAREIIPPYKMIRQPAKVFCLMPILLSLAAAMGLSSLANVIRKKNLRVGILACLTIVLSTDMALQMDATICLLDKEQAAYAAVAEDARARGKDPHALIVPLWPGDSAWTSIYQYYTSLYHIRMINGYSPAVPAGYIDKVFRRFESVNKGALYPDQLKELKCMGIQYIILHENAFPGKVSPFPVAFTLQNLLNNKRLELVKQQEEVWAFKIVDESYTPSNPRTDWDILFPTRSWQAERFAKDLCTAETDALASGGAYLRMKPGGCFSAIRNPRAPYTIYAPEMRWMIRTRGQGRLRVTTLAGASTNSISICNIDSESWTWTNVPLAEYNGHLQVTLGCELEEGNVMVDTAILAAGEWPDIKPGSAIDVPASCFFHAGYSDLDKGAVVLRPDSEPDAVVFYGLNLPLPTGQYDIVLNYNSPAEPGTNLGSVSMNSQACGNTSMNIISGLPVILPVSVTNSLPATLVLQYSRDAALNIHSVTVSRKAGR